MSIGHGEWKLWREAEPFSQRFTATFSDGGNTITGRWEIADDRTNYTADFDLIYRRVDTQRRITDILYVGCDPATAAKRATVPGQSTLGIDANHTRITTRPNDVAGNGHVAPERHHDWRHAVRLADPADQGRSEPSFGAPTGLDAVVPEGSGGRYSRSADTRTERFKFSTPTLSFEASWSSAAWWGCRRSFRCGSGV